MDIFKIHNILFIIVPIFILIIFAFTFVLIFSPKLRGKMMSNQLKSLKHMADYSKEDIKDLSNMLVQSKKDIMDSNYEDLKEINKKSAKLESEVLREKIKVFKDELINSNTYCKYCGEKIDNDSIYCKKCGKKQ